MEHSESLARRPASSLAVEGSATPDIAAHPSPTPLAVAAIHVRGLFGQYDYSFSAAGALGATGNLVILYGDNGSGKTTILKLIYHLLSADDNSGHRSAIARTPFKRFEVVLTNGVRIVAERSPQEVLGSYRLSMIEDGVVRCDAIAITDRNLSVTLQNWPEQHQRQWTRFIQELASLNLRVEFLGENRAESNASIESSKSEFASWSLARMKHSYADLEPTKDPLETAIERFEKWITDETLKASSIGEANINTLYVDVAKRIAQLGLKSGSEERDSSDLLLLIASLEARAESFTTLGLVPPLSLIDIRRALEESHSTTRSIMGGVLRPYLAGLSARFDALEPIKNLLTAFLGSVNSFFTHKRVSFDIKRGLRMMSASGHSLQPSTLSSGERQLLLQFCNTALARQSATIIIIDEPEISLNVKWQRQLIDALLGLVEGTYVQFVLASHSIELVAGHRGAVWRLDPLNYGS